MPYISPSVVQEVKRMDLLTYLKNYEPYELVHFSGNTYTTRTHDSLKISNGKWMWWSQRTGGRSALDYLIKVRGYSFLEAVELLAERANIQPSLSVSENVPMEKQLLLPKKNQDDQKVIAYLSGRGIDKEIIQFCLESGRVYESAFHHNAVFVGMDEKIIRNMQPLGELVPVLSEKQMEVIRTILFPFSQRNHVIRCICLSQPLICYLMQHCRNWTGRSGEENIYCHWQVSISQQKKLKKVKSLQRWQEH